MEAHQITFSVNDYDSDGDVCEHGVYLHFGDTRVKVARDKYDFEKVVLQMNRINKELSENY